MSNRSDDRRLVLLLAARNGVSPSETEALLARIAARLSGTAEAAGVELRFGCQIVDDPLAAVAVATGRKMTPVSALLQLTGDPETGDEALLRVVRGAQADLRDSLDVSISAAALGSVRRITNGPSGPVMLVVATRKLAGLSEPQFHTYWAEKHAPLALSMMPPGAAERITYEQLHAAAGPSRNAAEAAGVGCGDLAGVLQVSCREPADFLSVAAEPTFAARIYEDEKNFADQSAMRGGFVMLGPAALRSA